MNYSMLLIALVTILGLSACEKTTINKPAQPTVVVPGPAGPAGAEGAKGSTGTTGAEGVKGDTGKTGGTVVIVPDRK